MVSDHDPPSGLLAAGSAPPAIPTDARRRSDAEPPLLPAEDPLADVLRTVKLTGALYFVVEASLPWGIAVPDARRFAGIILPRAQHVVSYHIIIRGTGWIRGPGGAEPFAAGDVLVLAHEDSYAMLCERDLPPGTGAEESVAFFRAMAAGRLPFVVSEGGGGPGGAQFVCGFLGLDARPFNPLLAALPRLIHLRRPRHAAADLLDRLIELTLDEARRSRAGGACIRLGLSELMFVEVVRRYLAALPADGTGWLAGLRDPAVGRALALIHSRPAEGWTVEALAASVGISRSVLAERFANLIGQPPMQYLTRWRIQLAARMLADGGAKVAAVGRDVGYASEAAFSRAFKKLTGVAPAAWRRR